MQYSQEFKDHVVARVANGELASALARELGPSHGSIRRWCCRSRDRALAPRTNKEIPTIEERDRWVHQYLTGGRSVSDIYRSTGGRYSRHVVIHLLWEEGCIGVRVDRWVISTSLRFDFSRIFDDLGAAQEWADRQPWLPDTIYIGRIAKRWDISDCKSESCPWPLVQSYSGGRRYCGCVLIYDTKIGVRAPR